MSVKVEIRLRALTFKTVHYKEDRSALLCKVRTREKRIVTAGKGKGVTRW